MRYRVLLMALLLAACGGGGGGSEGTAPPPVARFAFVANSGNLSNPTPTLSAYTVDATTGQLRHNGYVVVGAGGGLTSVAVDPSNRFVYATNSSGVWGYQINATTGALTAMSPTAFSDTGVGPVAITVDPTGRFVLVANDGGSVSVYKIDATSGALTKAATSPFPAGTNPSAVSADASSHVYVANQGSNDVWEFSIDGNGLLTHIGTILTQGVTPLGIGVDPSGRFVYVVNRGSATLNVLGYKIEANGTLTAFLSGPVSAGSSPRSISFDPKGGFAYVANETTADVTVFSITSDGILQSLATAPTLSGGTWSATVDPSGKFTYAVNQGSGDVTIFKVDAGGGLLSRLTSVAARYSPATIAFTRGTSPVTYTPKFAYTANLGSSNISTFRINAGSGALTLVGAPVTSGGTGPFQVATDPAARFLYVGNETTSNVSAFKIDSTTGVPSSSGTPVAAGGINPDGTAVDPSGRFVYIGNIKTPESDSISAFKIDQTTGALPATTIAGTPIASGGSQPFSPAVDPSGRFLYTANFNSSNVSAFKIDPGTGALSPVTPQLTALTNAAAPFSAVVSPSGRFLYVANRIDTVNAGKGNVSVFAINLTNGALSELGSPNSPVPAGAGPRTIAVHPSGRFVYVANEDDSTVSAYQADLTSGVLGKVTGSPFPVGGGMRPLTVDPSGKFLYAAQTSTGAVSAFPIDLTTGAIGAIIGGAPVSTGDGTTAGNSPFTITTTGSIQ